MNSEIYIERVALANVRGIVGPITVDIPNPIANSVKGGVLLLYGENGSGKSSVCDALEFAVRGVLSRRTQDGEKTRRELMNLSAKDHPAVVLGISDGRQYSRGDPRVVNTMSSRRNIHKSRGEIVPEYGQSPIVIRRENIELFWRIPRLVRMDYFWDYLREPGDLVRTPHEEGLLREYDYRVEDLRREELGLKRVFPKHEWPKNFYSLPTKPGNSTHALRYALQRASKKFKKSADIRQIHEAIDEYTERLQREFELRADANTVRAKGRRNTDRLSRLLAGVGNEVAGAFYGIYEQEWIDDIDILIGSEDSIDVLLKRKRGKPLRPEDVLSEAGLDVLSLLINVELHIASSVDSSSKVIVFDDVFQSVDSVLRLKIIEHLARRLDGWQVIFTVHDRMWLDVLRREFNAAKYRIDTKELRSGGFGKTPTIINGGSGILHYLENSLRNHDPAVVIAGIAGRTLEQILDFLSVRLGAEVRRVKDDKYMIGNLLDPVIAEMNTIHDPSLRQISDSLSRVQGIRNSVGAHANEWADALSESEAIALAETVIELWGKFECLSCGKVVSISGPRRSRVLNRTCGC